MTQQEEGPVTREISIYILREGAEGKRSLRSERKKWIPCFCEPYDVAKNHFPSSEAVGLGLGANA